MENPRLSSTARRAMCAFEGIETEIESAMVSGRAGVLVLPAADVMMDGRGTLGLDTDQPRQFGDQPGGFQIVEGLVHAADNHAVADRHEDHIRRLEPVLLVNLQPDRLLPFDGQRDDRRCCG